MTSNQMKLVRLYLQLTQREFGIKMSLAESTVAKVEAGFTPVSEITRSRVLRKFDLTDPDFMTFCKRMAD